MFYLKILLFWKYSMLYFLLIWLKYYDSKFYINSDYTIFHFKIYKNYLGLYCKETGYDHYFNIIWLKYYDSKFYINSDYTIFHFKIYKNYPGLYCKEIGYDHYFNIIFQCKHPRKRKEEEEEERGR